jgi:hypothetical protein
VFATGWPWAFFTSTVSVPDGEVELTMIPSPPTIVTVCADTRAAEVNAIRRTARYSFLMGSIFSSSLGFMRCRQLWDRTRGKIQYITSVVEKSRKKEEGSGLPSS